MEQKKQIDVAKGRQEECCKQKSTKKKRKERENEETEKRKHQTRDEVGSDGTQTRDKTQQMTSGLACVQAAAVAVKTFET